MSLIESGAARRTLLMSGLGLAAAGTVGAAGSPADAASPGAAQAAPAGSAAPNPDCDPIGKSGAFVVPAGTGLSRWLNGDTYTFKAISEQTQQSFALVEASVPPAGGSPVHTHPISDEAFYLMSGSLEVMMGEETRVIKAGDFVYVPHGTQHQFRNIGVPTAQMLYIFAPGGPEMALIGWGTPTEPGVPVPPPEPAKPNPMKGEW